MSTTTPSTFLTRLRDEHDQLNEKLAKLKAFFNAAQFEALFTKDKDLLKAQAEHMSAYLNTLKLRLQEHEGTPESIPPTVVVVPTDGAAS